MLSLTRSFCLLACLTIVQPPFFCNNNLMTHRKFLLVILSWSVSDIIRKTEFTVTESDAFAFKWRIRSYNSFSKPAAPRGTFALFFKYSKFCLHHSDFSLTKKDANQFTVIIFWRSSWFWSYLKIMQHHARVMLYRYQKCAVRDFPTNSE